MKVECFTVDLNASVERVRLYTNMLFQFLILQQNKRYVNVNSNVYYKSSQRKLFDGTEVFVDIFT